MTDPRELLRKAGTAKRPNAVEIKSEVRTDAGFKLDFDAPDEAPAAKPAADKA